MPKSSTSAPRNLRKRASGSRKLESPTMRRSSSPSTTEKRSNAVEMRTRVGLKFYALKDSVDKRLKYIAELLPVAVRAAMLAHWEGNWRNMVDQHVPMMQKKMVVLYSDPAAKKKNEKARWAGVKTEVKIFVMKMWNFVKQVERTFHQYRAVASDVAVAELVEAIFCVVYDSKSQGLKTLWTKNMLDPQEHLRFAYVMQLFPTLEQYSKRICGDNRSDAARIFEEIPLIRSHAWARLAGSLLLNQGEGGGPSSLPPPTVIQPQPQQQQQMKPMSLPTLRRPPMPQPQPQFQQQQQYHHQQQQQTAVAAQQQMLQPLPLPPAVEAQSPPQGYQDWSMNSPQQHSFESQMHDDDADVCMYDLQPQQPSLDAHVSASHSPYDVIDLASSKASSLGHDGPAASTPAQAAQPVFSFADSMVGFSAPPPVVQSSASQQLVQQQPALPLPPPVVHKPSCPVSQQRARQSLSAFPMQYQVEMTPSSYTPSEWQAPSGSIQPGNGWMSQLRSTMQSCEPMAIGLSAEQQNQLSQQALQYAGAGEWRC